MLDEVPQVVEVAGLVPGSIQKLYDTLQSIENVNDIREVTNLMAASVKSQQSSNAKSVAVA